MPRLRSATNRREGTLFLAEMPTPSNRKLSVWYHCRMSGGEPHIELDRAVEIFQEQMQAYEKSGLLDAADEFYIGVNGGPADAAVAAMLAPAKAVIIEHPETARGEQPTMHRIQKWIQDNKDAYVCYAHGKGSCHSGPTKEGWDGWRKCMTRCVIWNWRTCCKDLDDGFDTVGAHWISPERYGTHICSTPYWGGTYWFATSRYLLTLVPIAETAHTRPEFYVAEAWIGYTSKNRILFRDYVNHWPGGNCAAYI